MANRVLQHIGAKERNNHSLKIKVRLKKLIKFRPHFFSPIITTLRQNRVLKTSSAVSRIKLSLDHYYSSVKILL